MHFLVASVCVAIVSPAIQLSSQSAPPTQPLHVAMPTPAKGSSSVIDKWLSQFQKPTRPRRVFKLAGDSGQNNPFHLVGAKKESVASRQQMLQQKYDRRVSTLVAEILPSAKVEVSIPAERTVRLRGTVERADEMQVVVEATRAIFGDVRIINDLAVAGPREMEVGVVIIRSRPESAPRGFSLVRLCRRYVSTIPEVVYAGDFENRLGIVNKTDALFSALAKLRQSNVIEMTVQPKVAVRSGRSTEFLGHAMSTTRPDVRQTNYRPSNLRRVGVSARKFNSQVLLEVEGDLGQRQIGGSVLLDPGQTFAVGPLERPAVQGGLMRRETIILVTPTVADR